MAQTAVDVVVRVKDLAALDRLKKSLAGVDGAALKASQGTKKLESALGQLGGVVGKIAAIAGVGLGFGKLFTDLEKADKANAALRTLGIETKSFNKDLQNLRESLNNNVSQLELQQGAFAVAQAGYKKTADQVKILEAAVKSSQAKLVGTDVSITAITSVLKAYGLEASSAASLSEKFFQTIADGNLTLPEYAQVIGGIAPLASAAGVSLNELNAGIAALTQRGLTAGEATTGLERIIAALIDPSDGASKAAADLGIAFDEQALKAKGLTGVLEEVAAKTGGSTQKYSELFGSLEAVNAIVALSSNNFEDFRKSLGNQEDAAGKVDKAYKEMSATIIGSLKRLQNTATVVGQSFVKDFGPAIVRSFDTLAVIIDSLQSPLGKLLVNIGLVTAAVIALNKAIVALKATALAAWLTQQAALMATFGAKIYAASAAAIALEKALLLAKAAFLSLPLALVALLVGEVTGAILDAKAAQDEWTQKMSTTETAIEALRAKAAELEGKLADVESASYSAATATGYTGGAFATASINAAVYADQLERVKATLLALTDPFAGANVIKGFDELTPSQTQEALKLAGVTKPTVPTGGATGGRSGGGTAARESRVPQLERELSLAKDLEALQSKINAAELAGNDQLKIRLEGEARMFELMKKESDILASDIPDAEKQLELLRLGVEVRMQALDTEQQLALLAQGELEARQNALAPLEEQRTYLEDILSYGEDEADIRREINRIMESTPGLDKDRVEELVRGNQALQERIDKFNEMKAQVTAVASTISSAFTSAFRSVIDGSKSAQEALSDAFTQIGNSFVDMALKIIEQQLTMIMQGLLMKALGISMPGSGAGLPSGGGFGSGAPQLFTGGDIFNAPFKRFADGGIPPVGKPSIVGEEGPEIFIPQERGLVLPNDIFEATKEALETNGEVVATSRRSGTDRSRPC